MSFILYESALIFYPASKKYNEIIVLKWLFCVVVKEQRWTGMYYPQIVFWCKISHKIQEKEKAGTAKMLMFGVWIRREWNGSICSLPYSGEHWKPKNKIISIPAKGRSDVNHWNTFTDDLCLMLSSTDINYFKEKDPKHLCHKILFTHLRIPKPLTTPLLTFPDLHIFPRWSKMDHKM